MLLRSPSSNRARYVLAHRPPAFRPAHADRQRVDTSRQLSIEAFQRVWYQTPYVDHDPIAVSRQMLLSSTSRLLKNWLYPSFQNGVSA